MRYRHWLAAPRQRLRYLQRAARISGDEQVCAGRLDSTGFPATELGGCRWLHEVVDSGRAAAGPGVGDIGQDETGNAAQQGTGLGRDALRISQVTGVVVGDGERQLRSRRHRFELCQELAEVPDPGAEGRGPAGPGRLPG